MALAARGNLRIVCTTHALGDFLMRARNRQLFQFLHGTPDGAGVLRLPRCDFFFCIGSDIDFDPAYLERIVARNLPIVAGLYAIKEHNAPGADPRWCFNKIRGAADGVSPDGLLEIAAGGTDFICFRRDALETMVKHSRVRPYVDDFPGGDTTRPHYHLFNFGVANDHAMEPWESDDWRQNRLFSEDYWACRIARDCGIKVMLETTGYCGHWDGRTRYPTNPPPQSPLPGAEAVAEQFKHATTTPEHGGAQ